MERNNEQVDTKQGHTYWQWIFAVLGNMTIFSYGLDVGWMSPMAKILQSENSPTGEPISDTMLSWIASLVCLAAVFSTAIYTYIADRFGSRISVIATAVPQAISWIIRLTFASGTSLIISRTFSGIAAGGCFLALVLYVKEISQDNIRGTLSSIMVVAQNSGVFVMYIMGVYLDYYTILWIVAGIPLVAITLLLWAPDSPPFLIKQGKIEEAITSLAFLRGLDKDHKIVINAITSMRNESEYFKSLPNMSLRNIDEPYGLRMRIVVTNPIWRRGMILSFVITSCQSLNGAFAITTYASTVLSSTGVQYSVSAETLTLSIPAMLLFGSIVAISCIEKIDRKLLNIIMYSITTFSMMSIGICILIKNLGGTVPNWLPILSMMISVWTYSAGIAPLPFLIMAEIFSFQLRPKVFGVVVTFAWLTTFLPVVGYMSLSMAVGIYNTFFIFAGINLFGVMFSVFFLPETRGKSVQEVENDIAVRIGLNKMEKNIT